MLARCARCQGTFTTDRYGIQVCPHCGSQVLLADPGAPPPAPGAEPRVPPQPPPERERPLVRGDVPPPPPPPGAPPPRAVPPVGPAPGDRWAQLDVELSAPFADRRERGFFGAFFETWRLASLDPGRFFRRVRIDQTRSAVLFAVIASTVGSWVASLFSSVTAASSAAQVRQMLEQLPPELEKLRPFLENLAGEMSGARLVGQLLLAPLFALVGLYLMAGVVHLLLLLFRGAPRGFSATLTAAGYASAPALLAAVPGCGGLVAAVWSVVALVIGLGETQRCGPGKAAAAVLLPVVLFFACACALAFVAIAAVMGSGGGTTI